jgi:hypothetical protein
MSDNRTSLLQEEEMQQRRVELQMAEKHHSRAVAALKGARERQADMAAALAHAHDQLHSILEKVKAYQTDRVEGGRTREDRLILKAELRAAEERATRATADLTAAEEDVGQAEERFRRASAVATAAAEKMFLHPSGKNTIRNAAAKRHKASNPPELPFGPPEDLPGYGLKPDPLLAETAAEFVELMKQYRIWAEEPSYRELVRRARNAFGASTLCEALKSTQLPPAKLVEAFIWACTGSKEDLQAWMTAWRRLRMKHQRPQGETLAPVTQLHPGSAQAAG